MYIMALLIAIISIYFCMRDVMKKIKTSFRCDSLRTNKSIRILLTASFFLLSAFFVGCDSKEEEQPVEITFVSGWGGTFQSHEVMRGIYEEFDRQNPDIILNFVPYSDNAIAVEKAIDMLAVGNEPDIVSTNGLSTYVEYAVRCGVAMDLMPYIEADIELKEQMHPAVFDTWKTEAGELYTIPDALEVAGYWYNEEYLLQAGVTDESGSVAVPKTWTEFMEMIEKVQLWIENEPEEISAFALEEDQRKGSFFLARLAGESEEGLRIATNAEPLMNKEILDTVISDLNKLSQYSHDVSNIEDARQKFSDGESVIFLGGVWEADEFVKSAHKDEIKFAAYPTYDGKSLSYVSASSGYVVAKQTDERKADACIRFLKYMLSESVQEQIARMTSQAPSNTHVEMDKISEVNPLLGQSLETAYSADIQIPTIYSVWDESKIEAIEEILENR